MSHMGTALDGIDGVHKTHLVHQEKVSSFLEEYPPFRGYNWLFYHFWGMKSYPIMWGDFWGMKLLPSYMGVIS